MQQASALADKTIWKRLRDFAKREQRQPAVIIGLHAFVFLTLFIEYTINGAEPARVNDAYFVKMVAYLGFSVAFGLCFHAIKVALLLYHRICYDISKLKEGDDEMADDAKDNETNISNRQHQREQLAQITASAMVVDVIYVVFFLCLAKATRDVALTSYIHWWTFVANMLASGCVYGAVFGTYGWAKVNDSMATLFVGGELGYMNPLTIS